MGGHCHNLHAGVCMLCRTKARMSSVQLLLGCWGLSARLVARCCGVQQGIVLRRLSRPQWQHWMMHPR